ncbi:hypothetical protein [Lichenicola sp.]|uniref:hypothetical protein n=1 Tax=Lichenicola sp. TaxID=2804529 RepID=UPI003B00B9ED
MIEPPVEIGPDDIHAQPTRTGRHWFDLTMALLAIFLSMVSLYVAFDHSKAERELVQANSWPFVQENTTVMSRGATEIAVFNAGIGPAKLHSFEVFYKGAAVHSPIELLQACCGLPLGPQTQYSSIPGDLSVGNPNDQVLRPGQNLRVMSLSRSQAEPTLSDRFASAVHDLTFRGCFCSVFDECWISDLHRLEVQNVARCPIRPDRFKVLE